MCNVLARAFAAACVCALLLGACGKKDEPPAPRIPQASQPAAPATTPAPLPQPAPPAPSADTAPGSSRPQSDLSHEESVNSMPKPGQANDHSSPAYEPQKPAPTDKAR